MTNIPTSQSNNTSSISSQQYCPTAIPYQSPPTIHPAANNTIIPHDINSIQYKPIQQYQQHIRRTGNAKSLSPDLPSHTVDPRITELQLMNHTNPASIHITDSLSPIINYDNMLYKHNRQCNTPLHLQRNESSSSTTSTNSNLSLNSPYSIKSQQLTNRTIYNQPVRQSQSTDIIHSEYSSPSHSVVVRSHGTSKHSTTHISPILQSRSHTLQNQSIGDNQMSSSSDIGDNHAIHTDDIPLLYLDCSSIPDYKLQSLHDVQSNYTNSQQYNTAIQPNTTLIQPPVQSMLPSSVERASSDDDIIMFNKKTPSQSLHRSESADTFNAATKHTKYYKSMVCIYFLIFIYMNYILNIIH